MHKSMLALNDTLKRQGRELVQSSLQQSSLIQPELAMLAEVALAQMLLWLTMNAPRYKPQLGPVIYH